MIIVDQCRAEEWNDSAPQTIWFSLAPQQLMWRQVS